MQVIEIDGRLHCAIACYEHYFPAMRRFSDGELGVGTDSELCMRATGAFGILLYPVVNCNGTAILSVQCAKCFSQFEYDRSMPEQHFIKK